MNPVDEANSQSSWQTWPPWILVSLPMIPAGMKNRYSLPCLHKLYILPAERRFCKYSTSWLIHILHVCVVSRCYYISNKVQFLGCTGRVFYSGLYYHQWAIRLWISRVGKKLKSKEYSAYFHLFPLVWSLLLLLWGHLSALAVKDCHVQIGHCVPLDLVCHLEESTL